MVNGEPCAPRGACTVLEGVSNAGLPHDLDVDVARLRLMKADHQSQQYRLEDQLLKVFPRQLEQDAQLLEGFAQDRATLAAHPEPEAEFGGLTVRGSFIEDKETAGKAILAACKEAAQGNPVEFGDYRGLNMSVQFDSFANKFRLTLRGAVSHIMEVGSDARGNITRLTNLIQTLPDRMAKVQAENQKRKTGETGCRIEHGSAPCQPRKERRTGTIIRKRRMKWTRLQ